MGSRVNNLNNLARQIWLWCKEREIFLTATFLCGSANVIADFESRHFNTDTEWRLDRNVFTRLHKCFGPCDIDLFASRLNYQLDKYMSWRPDPHAFFVDALSYDWSQCNGYAFPPFSLLPTVLQKVEQEQAQLVLVAPLWTTQAWFTKLLSLMTTQPVLLPKGVLHLPQDPSQKHPLNNKLRLLACHLSGKPYETRMFQRTLPQSSCLHGDNPQKSNMGLISADGCYFAIRGRLMHFRHL